MPHSIRYADCLGQDGGGNTLSRVLSREEKAVLAFERVWGTDGPKDRAIETVLGLSSGCYYEVLLSLVARRTAMAHDPLTVRRVLRIIETGTEEAAS